MRLYFVRHGESEANLLREFSNRNFEKHPLTPLGRQQAETLAARLRDTPFSEIYSSPLLRARQTSEILALGRNLSVQIAPELREHDAGDFEGRHDPEAWKQYQTMFEAWIQNQAFEERPPGGESFVELRARFVPFLERVVAKHAGTDANVLFVAHGGIYHALLPVVLDNIGFEYTYQHLLSNTAFVVAENRGKALHCLEWDGVSFGGEPTNEI